MNAVTDTITPFPEQTDVFTPYSFDDLLNIEPKKWLIDRVIGAGDIGMLYGAPGSGKTFVVINMIVAACTGSPWAERFAVAQPLNVAYCAGEGISGLQQRFKAATYGIGPLKNFTFFKAVPQLFCNDDKDRKDHIAETMRRFVHEWKVRQQAGIVAPLDILFIDTLHTATTSADENSSRDMGKVLDVCRWATKELGCAIILVHHTNKNGDSERGSSALRGAMDMMIEIKRTSETGTKATMHCSKLKDGEPWKAQTFDLYAVKDSDSVRVLWDDPNEGASTAKGKEEEHQEVMLNFLAKNPGTKKTAKILAQVASIGQNQAIKLLGKMVEGGKCKCELIDPAKDSSSRNPLGYFIG